MNRKQISILLAALVILGIGGIAVYRKQNERTGSAQPTVGKKVLPDFPYNDVAQISIQEGQQQVILVKKDGLWRVQQRNDYPANYGEISELLLKWNDLKVVQSEEVGPSDLKRLWLVTGQDTNNPVVIEFKDANGKLLQQLLLGKKHMRKGGGRPSPLGDMDDQGYPDGRYVLAGSSSRSVALVSDALSNVEPKPEQWLNKEFFKVEKPKAIAVTFPDAPTNSWALSRESETASDWKLADLAATEKLDSSKTSGVTSPFSAPSFNDVPVESQPEKWGLEKPVNVRIETFEGFVYDVRIGQKTNDTYALTLTVKAEFARERVSGKDEKPEDKEKLDKEFKEKQATLQAKLDREKGYENRVFLVSSWTVDSLLKERGKLLVEAKTDATSKSEGEPTAGAADAADHDHDEPPSEE